MTKNSILAFGIALVVVGIMYSEIPERGLPNMTPERKCRKAARKTVYILPTKSRGGVKKTQNSVDVINVSPKGKTSWPILLVMIRSVMIMMLLVVWFLGEI